mgnify:CR=1 FL=1
MPVVEENSPGNFFNPSFPLPNFSSSVSETLLIQDSDLTCTASQEESNSAIPESPSYTGRFGDEFLLLKRFLSWPNTLDQEDWARFEAVTLTLTEKVAALVPKNPRSNRNPGRFYRARQRRRERKPPDSTSATPHPDRSRSDIRLDRRRDKHQRNTRRMKNLRRMFNQNMKKCVNFILHGPDGSECKVPKEVIQSYFVTEYSNRDSARDKSNVPTWFVHPPSSDDASSFLDFSPKAVARQLKVANTRSAPGPDKATYRAWREADPEGTLLSVIFRICHQNRKIPRSWKKAEIILIYKKGDTMSLDNWRPIALQSTAYKLYAGVISHQLAGWAVENGKLSPNQKAFLPGEGCAEHIFCLQAALEDSRRHHKNIYVAWLDLRNAFGSVPHSTLLEMLTSVGIPRDIREIVSDIYTSSTFQVRTCTGLSETISQESGVRQGCPLSAIIFNIVMEGFIRGANACDDEHEYSFARHPSMGIRILAYADDVALTASSRHGLQTLLDAMTDFANWAGLRFRPEKCATLAVEYGANSVRVMPSDPFLCQNNSLPVLSWHERYKYLGKALGGECSAPLDKTKEQFLKDLEKIMSSSLAPWQKLLAFKVFLRPRFEYHLRVGAISKTWAKNVDLEVRKWLRIGLGLSKNTNQHIFYTSIDTGGLGVFELSRDVDAALVCSGVRMLNSKDTFVRDVAGASLRDTCAKRTGNDAASFETSFRWVSLPPDMGDAARGDISSFWVKVRNARRNLDDLVSLAAPSFDSPPKLLI